MNKIDLKKDLPEYFKANSKDFSVVKLPKCNYLMVDGKGDPNTSPAFEEAVQLLYGASYTLKFMRKSEFGDDYVVPPLEGLWWAKDMKSFAIGDKSNWSWTMMIMVPKAITRAYATKAIKAFALKKPELNCSKLRFESLLEGKSVQILHVGPYDKEAPVLSRMHNEFMPEKGLKFNGKHHEIYLGDPRRTALAKLKTILRQPVIGM